MHLVERPDLSKVRPLLIVNTLNKPESSVSIAMEEIPEKEWMKKVYDTEITPNLEKLYKKPGY